MRQSGSASAPSRIRMEGVVVKRRGKAKKTSQQRMKRSTLDKTVRQSCTNSHVPMSWLIECAITNGESRQHIDTATSSLSKKSLKESIECIHSSANQRRISRTIDNKSDHLFTCNQAGKDDARGRRNARHSSMTYGIAVAQTNQMRG